MKCKICNFELEDRIEKCPRCGSNPETGLPNKPSIFDRFLWVAIPLALVVTGIVFISRDSSTQGVILILVGLIPLCAALNGYSEDVRLYKLAASDPEKYMTENRERYQQFFERVADHNAKRMEHTPNCPICGSKANVRRLGNLDRTVSTAVWGVASSAIGKQWECTSCDHKFNVDAVTPTVESEKPVSASTPDHVEELRKYKNLLDEGLITQDDYDQKKRHLLDL